METGMEGRPREAEAAPNGPAEVEQQAQNRERGADVGEKASLVVTGPQQFADVASEMSELKQDITNLKAACENKAIKGLIEELLKQNVSTHPTTQQHRLLQLTSLLNSLLGVAALISGVVLFQTKSEQIGLFFAGVGLYPMLPFLAFIAPAKARVNEVFKQRVMIAFIASGGVALFLLLVLGQSATLGIEAVMRQILLVLLGLAVTASLSLFYHLVLAANSDDEKTCLMRAE